MRILLALVFLLAACTAEEPVDDGPCVDETRADEYAAGLTKDSELGGYSATLVDALPSPPDTGENQWTLEVTDSAGDPVDVDLLAMRPYMPDHGHGTNPATWPLVEGDEPDQAVVYDMDLFMPGLWRVAVEITPEVEDPDEVLFYFCAEG